jgi:hypothetical protein
MATTRSARQARPAPLTRGRRQPASPARKRLGLAVVLVILGSFLPWVYTALGSMSGVRGAGLWTFYASMLGLGAVLLPFRRFGAIQAAIMAGVAVALPTWQVVHVLGLVGFGGWMPGPGLVMVFGGGVLAGAAAWQLFRETTPAPG